MKTNTHYPKSFSHKGITVPDIHQAVTFYAEVMGWYVIMEPVTIKKEIRP
jgi:predicted enzyme related to lactoylglutathione lyase